MSWRAFALVLTVTGLVAGCGDDSASQAERGPAIKFHLTHVPDGYELAGAGRGNTVPVWGSDLEDSDEPTLVLGEPDQGDPTDGRMVVVAATSYREHQGGLAQASSGYSRRRGHLEEIEVGGRKAVYTVGAPVGDEVVVDQGSSDAIRVTGEHVARADLLDVAAKASLVPGPGATARPVVTDPPEGLAVLSEATVDLAVAVTGPAVSQAQLDVVPGTDRSYAVSYRGGPDNGVSVVSVPGGTADLLAARYLARPLYGRAAPVEVAGRAGLVLSSGEGATALLVAPAAGGLLVVIGGRDLLNVDELKRVAAGVEVIDEASWDAQVVAARGGPGLRPDRGGVELARGGSGGIEWLLQAMPNDQQELIVDPCLRLADGRHACATGSGSTGDAVMHFGRGDDRELATPFVSGTVPPDVARVRVEGRSEHVEVATVPIPNRDVRAFVAIVEGFDGRWQSVELLNADGDVVDVGDAP